VFLCKLVMTQSEMLHLAAALVKSLAGVLVRLSAVVLVAARPATGVGSVAGADASIVESAVSTVRNTVLVEVVGVKAVARGEVRLASGDGGCLVQDVLVRGVVGTDLGVEGAGEELGTHPVVGSVDGLAAAGLGAAPGRARRSSGRGGSRRRSAGRLDNRRGRSNGGSSGKGSGGGDDGRSGVVDGVNDGRGKSGVGSIVSVGSGHDNSEITTVAALVGSGGSLKVGSPQSALEVGDGGRLRAPVTPNSRSSGVVLAGVLAGIALDVDVERSAESGGVTVSSTVSDAVGLQGVETNVRVGAGRGVQVAESLLVCVTGSVVAGNDSRSSAGHAVEGSVGKESISSVGSDLGTISVWLRSTWVLRVDETAVGAILGGGRAGSGGRASSGDSVDGGSAGRGGGGSSRGRRGSRRRAGAGAGLDSRRGAAGNRRRRSLSAAAGAAGLDDRGSGRSRRSRCRSRSRSRSRSRGTDTTLGTPDHAIPPVVSTAGTLLKVALVDNLGRGRRDSGGSGADNDRAGEGNSLVGDTVQDGGSLNSRGSSQLVKVELLRSRGSGCEAGKGCSRDESCGRAHDD